MAALGRMIARHVFDPSPLITHTRPLADASEAYTMMSQRRDGALKVVLTP
jgi:S-(hydroxymethyl)glutathione dehydrogenase/alcohol dehydrogenase